MLIYLGVSATSHSNAGKHEKMLSAFTNLKDIDLRQKWEDEQGLFLAESHNVILRAIEAGHSPAAFLVTPQWLEKLQPVLTQCTGKPDGAELPVFVIEEEHSHTITGFRVHRGAIAAMRRPAEIEPWQLLSELDSSRPSCVAILEDLVDHTNVGAIFRSAAALGVEQIYLSPSCADPLYRRSIRVSMGAVFQIPWARIPNWPSLDSFKKQGFITCALTPSSAQDDLDNFIASLPEEKPNIALIVGSEGPGLTRGALENADTRVRIPLSRQIDSLNVATASAIAFWEASRYIRNN